MNDMVAMKLMKSPGYILSLVIHEDQLVRQVK